MTFRLAPTLAHGVGTIGGLLTGILNHFPLNHLRLLHILLPHDPGLAVYFYRVHSLDNLKLRPWPIPSVTLLVCLQLPLDKSSLDLVSDVYLEIIKMSETLFT